MFWNHNTHFSSQNWMSYFFECPDERMISLSLTCYDEWQFTSHNKHKESSQCSKLTI